MKMGMRREGMTLFSLFFVKLRTPLFEKESKRFGYVIE
jgi:hypothetical protein